MKTEMDKILVGNEDQIIAYKAGQTVGGLVFDVTSHRILVDLPGGITGIITKKEASGYGVTTDDIEKDTKIEAFIIDPENEEGLVLMSLRRANMEMVWAEVCDSSREERIVKVKIMDANKGGLMALYKGLKAFLPVSQLTPMNYPRVDGADSSEILNRLLVHVGKEFAVRVITADRDSGKLIVSEKAAVAEQRQQTLKDIKAGDVVEGTVSGIVKFGIFVAFGGVEGLVHLSELDWGHVSDPGKKFGLNDKVEVLILSKENDKLSLSIKRLTDDPWRDQVTKFKVGDAVTGKVTRWNTNGVFIDVADDVPGLISLSQFGVENHSELEIKESQEMTGEIVEIDYESHRLILKKA